MKTRFLVAVAALVSSLAVVAQAQQAMPPQLTYVQPLSPTGVRAVQQQLRYAGYYNGQMDGIWGPDSVVALQEIPADARPADHWRDEPGDRCLTRLDPDALLGTSQTASSVQQSGTLNPQAVHAIQVRLGQLGFYRGPRDGVWGPDTQAAIEQFQQSRGLEPNSQLNPATIAALGLPPEVLATR